MASQRQAWARLWRSAALGTLNGAAKRPAPRHRIQTNTSVRYLERNSSGWPGGRRPRYRYTRFGEEEPQDQGPSAGLRDLLNRYPRLISITVLAGGAFYVYNLETVPITGRRRFNYISPALEDFIFHHRYEMVLHELRNELLPDNHPYTQLCKDVVTRLIQANGLQNWGWTVHVVHSDEPNAFVMAGGQIFVFTGILPIAKSEDGLAAVIGHEISHRLVRHTAEQLSGRVWALAFAIIANMFVDFPGGLSEFVYDIAVTFPNSRTMEEEADYIGLLLSARACYDPEAAVTLWTRMIGEEDRRGGSTMPLLSTHPASADRIENLRRLLPLARDAAEEARCASTKTFFGDFQETLTDSRFRTTGNIQGSSSVPTSQSPDDDDDDDWF